MANVEDVSPLVVKIERPLYEQEQLHTECGYHKPPESNLEDYINSYRACKLSKAFLSLVPAIRWLREYHWKADLTGDLIAGFTVAIMNIPQGMAYALLGNVPAIYGLYMGFFPVLVYCFLGTSRHNSMGTFAVVCLMTGKTVLKHSDPSYFESTVNSNNLTDFSTAGYSPIQVATVVTFFVGFFQIIMYAFRLGAISMLLSDTLVSGFTTAAAVQVFTSQVKDLLGLEIPRISGYFEVIYTYISIFKNITSANLVALLISIVTISILILNNEVIKPRVAKLCAFPIPVELVAVIIGTVLSKYLNFSANYNVKIIGHVPKGMPLPTIPKFSLADDVIIDALLIAIVSFALTLSMGLIFAQKQNYEVDANQELVALGCGNMFGSFFQCLPFCASISRSLIQDTVGGRTQLSSLISCSILFVVLMWLGPVFEPLPKAILASIIIVAVKGMLTHVRDFFKFLELSKMDAFVWLITFLSVIIIGVDIGLLVGVILSLVCIFIWGLKPYVCLLGALPHTDLYLDITRYKGISEIPNIKIFHYRGGINFASRTIFKQELYKTIGINPQQQLVFKRKLENYENKISSAIKTTDSRDKLQKMKNKIVNGIRYLILDFSAVSFMDPSGVSTIKQVADAFLKIDVIVLVTGCSGPVYEMLKKCGLAEIKESPVKIFPTVHDAVQYATGILDNSVIINSISTITV